MVIKIHPLSIYTEMKSINTVQCSNKNRTIILFNILLSTYTEMKSINTVQCSNKNRTIILLNNSK